LFELYIDPRTQHSFGYWRTNLKTPLTDDLKQELELRNLDVLKWECGRNAIRYVKDWACSYSVLRRCRPVCRLEVPRDRVILILGFGAHLQALGPKPKPSKYLFVVGLGEKPLITKHDGVQRCVEIELLPWAASRLFRGASTEFRQGIAIWKTSGKRCTSTHRAAN